MTEEKKPMKIEFAPGCFDDFNGTQEELNALMVHLTELVSSGKLMLESEPLTDEEALELEEHLLKKRDNTRQ